MTVQAVNSDASVEESLQSTSSASSLQLSRLSPAVQPSLPVISQIPLRYPASEPACALVRDLVCDLLASWSQTWFPTCHRRVRAISTCRDSSNLVADRFAAGELVAVLLASRIARHRQNSIAVHLASRSQITSRMNWFASRIA